MKSILITGSNGFIARNIAERLKDCDVTLTNRSNLNPLNSEEVDSFFKDKYFDVVFHTAIKGGSRLNPDQPNFVYENCLMHFNILRNQNNFGKYISFGSGAEFDRSTDINESSDYYSSFPLDPYGMSKLLIAKSGESFDKFFNLRIFNIFSEDELPTRMIKGNILKYINKENLIIHQDKFMDFMYFDDFMKVINFYIENDICPKYINCCYKKKYLLSSITNIINNLSSHKVDIKIENSEMGNTYVGKFDLNKLDIKINDLQTGIEMCYYKIKNGK
jgi:nucleoside-diphosphate-sugar epimerase